MTDNGMLKIGHRGAPSHFWENTLRSLQHAIELGVDMVEFDIRRTVDNHFVLAHSDKLRSIPLWRGRIGSKKLDELAKHRAKRPERFPLLQDALDIVKGKAYMNIDLKSPGGEEDLVKLLVQKGVQNQVLVSSYFEKSLKKIKSLEPQILTGISIPKDWCDAGRFRQSRLLTQTGIWIMRRMMRLRWLGKIRRAEADAVMIYYRLLTPGLVRLLRRWGFHVFAYTVDDLDSIKQVAEMGVQGIASNRPELLIQS